MFPAMELEKNLLVTLFHNEAIETDPLDKAVVVATVVAVVVATAVAN